jgi:hypothetical protein
MHEERKVLALAGGLFLLWLALVGSVVGTGIWAVVTLVTYFTS